MKKKLLLLPAMAFSLLSQSQSWSLTGNAGTKPTTNFLGTTDKQPLRFRINNIWAGELNPSTGNISLGLRAGIGNTTGFSNVGIGTDALKINTTKSNLVAIGDSALFNNNLGYFNTAIGSKTLYSNTYGIYNTAVGYQALYANTGSLNTSTGVNALRNNISGSDNTANGVSALLSNTSGGYNAAFGEGALYYNTTGNYNVALGPYAMIDNTYGTNNVAVGTRALAQTLGSQYNTAVGYNAGISYDLGYNNTILGANCGGSFAGQYNMVAIGQGVVCPDNSMARIGNSATWSIGGYAGWSNFSDGRFKKDIKEEVKGLDFIMKLRPVVYHLDVTALSKQLKENQGEAWNAQMKTAMAEKEKIQLTGFVAQEVEQAAKETDFDFSGVDKPKTKDGLYALRYAEFVVPLVKAMQEQQQMIKDLQAKVETLQQQADITILLRESVTNDKISTYPDPAGNTMTVSITTQQAGNGMLQLYDSGGKLVRQLNIEVHTGVNTVPMSLPGMAAGYYTIKLDWGNSMHKQISFVKAGQ